MTTETTDGFWPTGKWTVLGMFDADGERRGSICHAYGGYFVVRTAIPPWRAPLWFYSLGQIRRWYEPAWVEVEL